MLPRMQPAALHVDIFTPVLVSETICQFPPHAGHVTSVGFSSSENPVPPSKSIFFGGLGSLICRPDLLGGGGGRRELMGVSLAYETDCAVGLSAPPLRSSPFELACKRDQDLLVLQCLSFHLFLVF